MSAKTSVSVAYMGPAGTFSHVAARMAFPDAAHVEVPTIANVIEQVAAKNADFGVVPIENSTEGSVMPTLDALLDGTVHIRSELVVDVALCLLARNADRSRIQRVASHPQPLAQCRRWLARELPQATPWPTGSTVVAAREALADDSVAAVASKLAAELHGLTVIAENIQESEDLLDANKAPVIKLVNMLLFQALKLRASDIHLQPYADRLQVRMRIDGVLYDMESVPKRAQEAIVSRVKVMGKMDIAERRLPQDGRASIRVARQPPNSNCTTCCPNRCARCRANSKPM